MAATICDQMESQDYKTVRLLDGRIRLFVGQKSYTFKEGDIKSAEIESISSLSPQDLSPIQECFVSNSKVYYIRGNKAYAYEGQTVRSFPWDPNTSDISRLVIKKRNKIIGFLVPPHSRSGGSGQSMAQSNDILVVAYGSGSFVSVSSSNGNIKINYNGWSVPSEFNAFIANSDNSLTFFSGGQYCVAKRNSNSDCDWKDVKSLFGC